MQPTNIQWAEEVWNPLTGCEAGPISSGCENCYARKLTEGRLRGRSGYPQEDPFQVIEHWERLEDPIRRIKGKRVFVCSMGDLALGSVDFVKHVFNVMDQCYLLDRKYAQAIGHTFYILTKRPGLLRESISEWIGDYAREGVAPNIEHIWIGVSVENQATADDRIPDLLAIPGKFSRFVSCEPLLGPISLSEDWLYPNIVKLGANIPRENTLNWVIAGGETGPKARPCDPQSIHNIAADCNVAGVPFFFKQWGANSPVPEFLLRDINHKREIPDTWYQKRFLQRRVK